jgi:hypothetical protein
MPICSSSALLKPVKALPAKIEVPESSVAPTRALERLAVKYVDYRNGADHSRRSVANSRGRLACTIKLVTFLRSANAITG